MLFLLRTVSALMAWMPEWIVRGLTAVVAEIVFWGISRRRRSVLSNLSHAFPDKPHRWLVRMGRRSFRRMIETGVLALAYPQLPLARIAAMASVDESFSTGIPSLLASRRPTVIAIPHLGAWDLCSAIPLVYDKTLPEVGAVFRPLRNAKLDHWVRSARERFGVHMLSRKAGFNEGMEILRRGGAFGILFDQNARGTGALSLFFDRVCSTTNLPGLMVEKFDAQLAVFHTRRLAFWRYRLALDILEDVPREADAVTLRLNRWLEDTLRSDEQLSSSWLWVHNRWKTQIEPERRFRLEHRRSILPDGPLPRVTRFFVRLPDGAESVRLALPFLVNLRHSRPDAAIMALVPRESVADARASGAFDELITLPESATGRLVLARRLRRRYPDCWIVLAAGAAAGVEARLVGCPQRFGVALRGKRRRGLTHVCEVSGPALESEESYAAFFEHFGMVAAESAARHV